MHVLQAPLTLALLLFAACSGGAEGPRIPVVDPGSIEPEVEQRITAATQELRANPESAAAWQRLGLLYEANDFLALAADCYRSAIERDAVDPKLWYRLGIVSSSAGQGEAAVHAMSRCIELQDDYAPAHWRLGSYLFDVNDLEGAERAFRRAREQDPKHLGGWTGLARIQLQRGEGEAAIETLNGALTLKPKAPLVRKLLRSAYFEAGRVEQARALHIPFERIGSMGGDPWQRELRSQRIKPPMELALELLRAGDHQGAIDVLEPFIRENPDDPNAYAYLASGQHGLGRIALAKTTLARALEKQAESTVVLRVLVSLHLAANEVEEALEVLERILTIDPLDLEAWRQKGDLEARLGRDRAAIESWRQVARFDQRDLELMRRIESTAARLSEAENP